MKKTVVLGIALAVVLFSGCSDSQDDLEVVDPTKVNAQEVEKVDKEDNATITKIDSNDVTSVDGAMAGDGGDSTSIDNSSVIVEDTREQLMAELESKLKSIYFSFDKYDVGSTASEAVVNNAMHIKEVASNIKIEGNCDESGTSEYNMALGLKRAKSTKDVLMEEGILESRISMISYGEGNPICTSRTKECYKQNRRVDFKVLP